jgi:hypothetical protein
LDCCGYLTSTRLNINHNLEFGTFVTFKLLDLRICNTFSINLFQDPFCHPPKSQFLFKIDDITNVIVLSFCAV